jgi:hypothetical protein
MDLQTLPGARETLTERLERMIRERTSGLIRDLRVTVNEQEVVVTGRAATYYAKQLATHAALEGCEQMTLTNDIEVF